MGTAATFFTRRAKGEPVQQQQQQQQEEEEEEEEKVLVKLEEVELQLGNFEVGEEEADNIEGVVRVCRKPQRHR